MTDPKVWLDRIRALPLEGPVRIMNVCGGHERSVTMSGMRTALPDAIEIIPGPGCPVCVCPEEDIYQAVQLALKDGVILVAFGVLFGGMIALLGLWLWFDYQAGTFWSRYECHLN